jgi:hypothetical protein
MNRVSTVSWAWFRALLVAGPAACLVTSEARGEVDCEGAWSLVDPMPPGCMPPLDTDRPHLTDSPYPVPAGHFQLESGLVTTEIDRGGRVERVLVFDQMYKVGLYRDVDLQLLYVHAGLVPGETRSNVPAPLIRAKIMLWEDLGARPAVTLVPILSLPWREEHALEAGGHVFMGWDAGPRTSLELNAGGWGYRQGGPWRPALALAGASTVTLIERLRAFAELAGVQRWDAPGADFELRAGTGVMWMVAPAVQLDTGAYIVLAGDVPRAAPFAGASFRL